jgi:hypothetical protein
MMLGYIRAVTACVLLLVLLSNSASVPLAMAAEPVPSSYLPANHVVTQNVDLSPKLRLERARLEQLLRENSFSSEIKRQKRNANSSPITLSPASFRALVDNDNSRIVRRSISAVRAAALNERPPDFPSNFTPELTRPWVSVTEVKALPTRSVPQKPANARQLQAVGNDQLNLHRNMPTAVAPAAIAAAVPFTGINRYWKYEDATVPGDGHYFVNVGGLQNLVLQSDDMTVPNKGIALAFRRTYNSQSTHDYNGTDGSTISNYGDGWTNSFDAHAAFNTGNAYGQGISIFDIDGARYDFLPTSTTQPPTSTANAIYAPPPGRAGDFVAMNQYFICWAKKGTTIYCFYRPDLEDQGQAKLEGEDGRLADIFGRNKNNFISFTYSFDSANSTAQTINKLVVSTEAGQSATLVFSNVTVGSGSRRLLTSLTRPDGVNITYGYASNGQLQLVSKPISSASMTTCASTPTITLSSCLTTAYYYVGSSYLLSSTLGPRAFMGNQYSSGYLGFQYQTGTNSKSVSEVDSYGVVNPSISDGGYSSGSLQAESVPSLYRSMFVTPNSGTVTVSDTDLHKTVYDLNTNNAAAGLVSGVINYTTKTATLNRAFSYDTTNYDLLAETDARGNETDYLYDSSGNQVAAALPTTTSSDGTFRPTTLVSFDQQFNAVASCDPYFVHHTLGMDWPSNSKPTVSDTLCPAEAGAMLSTYATSQAEAYGELTSTTSPMGYVQNISYATSSQGGGSTDYGLPTSEIGAAQTQANNVSTQVGWQRQYDQFGNIVCWTEKNQNSNGWYEATYNAENQILKQGDPDDSSVSSSACTVSKTAGIPNSTIVETASYFPDGKLASLQNPGESAAGVATTYAYDADGNVTLRTSHEDCPASQPPPSPAPTGALPCYANAKQMWYDGDDRLVEVSIPAINRTPWLTRYFYDLSQGGTVSPGSGVTAFSAYGNLFEKQTYVSNAWQPSFGNSFDALDRPTADYDLGISTSSVSSFTYDTAPDQGFLASSQDGVGNVQSLSYDQRGIVTGVTYGGSDAGKTPSKTITTDSDGRTSSIASSIGTEQLSYDADSHLLSKVEPAGPYVSPYTFSYQYLLNGLKSSASISSTNTNLPDLYQYYFDASGQVSGVTVNYLGAHVFSSSMTLAGRPSTENDPTTGQGSPAFTATQYSYDSYGRTSAILLPGRAAPGYSPIGYYAEGAVAYVGGYYPISHIGQGNPTAVIDSSSPSILVDGYTVTGELTNQKLYEPGGFTNVPGSATGYINGGVTSGGSAVDGRAVSDNSSFRIGAGFESCSGTQSYDNAGRESVENETCARNNGPGTGSTAAPASPIIRTFDSEDRIITANGPSPAPSTAPQPLVYNSEGRPTNPELSGSKQQIHWDGDSPSVSTDLNGNIIDVYLGSHAVFSSAGGYSVFDRSPDGTIESYRGITASGGTVFHSGWYTSAPITYTFPTTRQTYYLGGGNPVDFSTLGLITSRDDGYNFNVAVVQGVRDYDPATGTFMSRDLEQGELDDPKSEYPYVWNRNNPVQFNDPSGLDASDCKKSGTPCLKTIATVVSTFIKNTVVPGLETAAEVPPVPGPGLVERETASDILSASRFIAKNRAFGLGREAQFAAKFGGEKITLKTPIGVRHVDNFLQTTIREVKAGYTTLTPFVSRQIDKDVSILKDPTNAFNQAEWHFYPGSNGEIGPSGPLEDVLHAFGIGIFYHY